MIRTASGKKIDRRGKCSVVGFWVELYVCSAQSKLAIVRLPEVLWDERFQISQATNYLRSE